MVYVERYSIKRIDRATGFPVLERYGRESERFKEGAGIVPLCRILMPIGVEARMGSQADERFSKRNSLDIARELMLNFHLDKYSHELLFHPAYTETA